MANSITLFKKYIDLLDEVYQNASVTSALDGDMTLVQMGANTNEIVIPKISMDGLADYFLLYGPPMKRQKSILRSITVQMIIRKWCREMQPFMTVS